MRSTFRFFTSIDTVPQLIANRSEKNSSLVVEAAYAGEDAFRTTVIRACRNSPELKIAFYKPARVCEKLFADFRSVIEVVFNRSSGPKFYALENAARMDYVDRIYTSNKPSQQQPKARFGRAGRSNYQDRTSNDKWKKKCFVCQKEGCWSTKHTPEKRKRSQTQYISQCHIQGIDFGSYATFLAGFEDVKLFSNDPESENSYEKLDDYDTIISVSYLMNQIFLYKITSSNAYISYDHTSGDDHAKAQLKLFGASGTNPPSDCDRVTAAAQFFLKDRYSIHRFQDTLPNTGAFEFLTAGKKQFLAL
jgi:hypothetical protein